jgi:hypothetical protein
MMATSATWRDSRLRRLEAAAISVVGYRAVAGLGATFRWKVEGREHFDQLLASGRPPIMAFWHGRILPATVYFRRLGIVVMTSENFDGEWIAGIIERFGYGAARGSTSRGGARALVQMRSALASGRPAALTIDGPRGPARVAQPGAVWLAKATGYPVLPFHMEASRSWTLRSWDRTQVPRPFSTIGVAIGPPLEVARDADDQAVEAARLALESRLRALEQRAEALLARGAPR